MSYVVLNEIVVWSIYGVVVALNKFQRIARHEELHEISCFVLARKLYRALL